MAIVVAACAPPDEDDDGASVRADALDEPAPAEGPLCFEPPAVDEVHMTIAAVGDILLHEGLQRQAFGAAGFASLFGEVAPGLARADVTYGNFEGAISGPVFDEGAAEEDPGRRGIDSYGTSRPDPGLTFDGVVYSSYPMFGYHPGLALALSDAGFDVVSTANNHSLDRRAAGIERTIAGLERADIAHTGTQRAGDASNPRLPVAVTEQGGLRVAWVACTYGTNGVPDNAYQVTMCYGPDESSRRANGQTVAPYSHQPNPDLLREVQTLAADTSIDAVVVTPHWGSEYLLKPKHEQRTLARALFDAGATVILGAHPHVIEPWERDEATGGLVVYSLGNFVSGQGTASCSQLADCQTGVRTGLATFVTLAKRPGDKVRVAGATYAPLTMLSTPTWHLVRSDVETEDAETPANRALIDASRALVERVYGPWNRQTGAELTRTPACGAMPTPP